MLKIFFLLNISWGILVEDLNICIVVLWKKQEVADFNFWVIGNCIDLELLNKLLKTFNSKSRCYIYVCVYIYIYIYISQFALN